MTTHGQTYPHAAATPSAGKKSVGLMNTNGNNKNATNGTGTKQPSPPCPLMEFITVDEFESVPK
jgi:hypothetical protein